jgi:hypothetical protein
VKSELETPSAGQQARVDASRYGVLSRLADDLAHEIKNPLSSILINLELMRQRVLKGDATVAIERAAVIEDETHRVHNLVDGLLRLMRPHKDGRGPHSAAESVTSVLPLLQARAHALGVSCEGGPPPLEAYTPVTPDALRFAVVVCGTDALGLARAVGGNVTIESEVGAGAETLLLRISVAPVQTVAATTDAASADAMALAQELIAAAGGSIKVSGGTYEIGFPLSKR